MKLTQCTFWLRVGLHGPANSNLSVVNYHHFHEEYLYLEKLYVFFVYLWDRIVITRSGVLSKNVMIKTHKNNTFVCCFIWVWNLASYWTEEQRLRLCEGSVVRRIFWSKGTLVRSGWGTVYNKDLRNFTIHWLLIRECRETGYVARTRAMTNAYV